LFEDQLNTWWRWWWFVHLSTFPMHFLAFALTRYSNFPCTFGFWIDKIRRFHHFFASCHAGCLFTCWKWLWLLSVASQELLALGHSCPTFESNCSLADLHCSWHA
jgi:hypothetical protein